MLTVRKSDVVKGFTESLETWFAGRGAGLVKVGHGKAPDGAGSAYVYAYSSTTATSQVGGLGNPEGAAWVRMMVVANGTESQEQALDVMDDVVEFLFRPAVAGGYENPITAARHVVSDRRPVTDIGEGNEGEIYRALRMVEVLAMRTQ